MSGFSFWLPVGFYLAGWLLDMWRYWRITPAHSLSGAMLAVGWGAHTLLLAGALWEGANTLSHLLSGLGWLTIAVYFILLRHRPRWVFGCVFPPFALASMLLGELLSARLVTGTAGVSPLIGQQVLIVHIATVLAGQVLLALACLLGIAYLYQQHQLKAKLQGVMGNPLPSLDVLEHLNHKAIILGFFFLSAGILLGFLLSGWREPRGGSWRQAISLGSWLVYAAFLLEHSLQGRRGRFGAICSIIGFIVVSTAFFFELRIVFG